MDNTAEQLESAVEVLLRKNRTLESQLARERLATEEANLTITRDVIEALTRTLRLSNCYVVHLGDQKSFNRDKERIEQMLAYGGGTRLAHGVWRLDDAKHAARYSEPAPTALSFALQTPGPRKLRAVLFEYMAAYAAVPERSIGHYLGCVIGSRTARQEEARIRNAEAALQQAEDNLYRVGCELSFDHELAKWITTADINDGLQALLSPALAMMKEKVSDMTTLRNKAWSKFQARERMEQEQQGRAEP